MARINHGLVMSLNHSFQSRDVSGYDSLGGSPWLILPWINNLICTLMMIFIIAISGH